MDNSIISENNSNISENNYNISDSKKKIHIHDLPYEIIEVIFKNLKINNYQAYINSSMVCRQWRYMLHKDINIIMVKEHAKVLFFEDLLVHTDEDIINFSGLLISNDNWIKACKLKKYRYRFKNLIEYIYPKYDDYIYQKIDTTISSDLQCKGLALFPNLKEIYINFNPLIKDLNFLNYCPLVEILDVGNNDNLKDLTRISNLYNLKHLSLDGCKIKNLNFIKNLKNIESLILTECDILESLHGIENFSKLEELDCNDCFNLRNMDSLKKLKNIKTLLLSTCNLYIDKIPILGSYDKVTTLDISYCDKINNLKGLDKYINLQNLDIECTDGITDFYIIKKLNKIKTINMTCISVTEQIYKNIHEHFINNNIDCTIIYLN
tara:strand:- start:1518 stop:2654 length:1137 start_codon:yes stop_codon:yes gene_type:complete